MSASLEILAYEETSLGMLCLRRRPLLSEPGTLITEITLNHEFLMSSLNTNSERALADMALALHKGKHLEILVGGLGLGYTAHAALKSRRVKQVEVIEFLSPVIQWLKDGLTPLSDELNQDKRLKIVQADFYQEMSLPPKKKYDLVLVDIDHSPKEHLHLENNNFLFYTKIGLREAKQHLNSQGILAVWSYAENSAFADALREVFNDVRIEKIEFENKSLRETHTDWLFFARDLI